MIYRLIFLMLFFLTSCSANEQTANSGISAPDENLLKRASERMTALQNEYGNDSIPKFTLSSSEWQALVDSKLQKVPNDARSWHLKAMPLFKAGKYELGMKYIDEAVKHDPDEQPYRAFIKCIFAKTYQSAIDDFEDCKRKFGNQYVMDHTYDFHIALSYIQLNEFEIAESILEKEIDRQLEEKGEDLLHFIDLFYLGITKYELGKFSEAIESFDKSIKFYPKFSDALYYKAACLDRLEKIDESRSLYAEAKKLGKAGNTFNEDNAIYERYPYQVRWHLKD